MTKPLRGALAAALTATLPMVALAQASAPAATPARTASSPAPAAKPAASAARSTYQSAFEGYRAFDDQKVQHWRNANDNVGRIGGWQAYARESAGEETTPAPSGDHSQHKPASQALPQPPAASTPGASPAPVKAAQPAANPASMPRDAHKGHGGHPMPKKP